MTDERKSSMPDDVRSFLRQVSGKGRPIDPRRIEPPADIPPRVDPPEPPRPPSLRAYRAVQPVHWRNGHTSPAGELHYLSLDDLGRVAYPDALEELTQLDGLYVTTGGQAVVHLDAHAARPMLARGEARIVLLDDEIDALRRLIFLAPPSKLARKGAK